MAMVFLDQSPSGCRFHCRHRIMSTQSQRPRKQQTFQREIARGRLHRSVNFHSGNHQSSSCTPMGRRGLRMEQSDYYRPFMRIRCDYASLGILSDPSRRKGDYPSSINSTADTIILLNLFVLLRFLYDSLVLFTTILSSSQGFGSNRIGHPDVAHDIERHARCDYWWIPYLPCRICSAIHDHRNCDSVCWSRVTYDSWRRYAYWKVAWLPDHRWNWSRFEFASISVQV